MSSVKIPVEREYEPAPICLGGGFVFPELNDGIPWRTPEEWERLLSEAGTPCDWPKCPNAAAEPAVVNQFTPFLCRQHWLWVVEPTGKPRTFARKLIKDHLRDLVFIASYGSPRRKPDAVPIQLTVPYVPYRERDPKVEVGIVVPARPVTRMSFPKLGQNVT